MLATQPLYILTYIPIEYTFCLYKCDYFNQPKALLYTLDSAKWVSITSKDLKDFLIIEPELVSSHSVDVIISILTQKFKDNKHYTSILTFLRGE